MILMKFNREDRLQGKQICFISFLPFAMDRICLFLLYLCFYCGKNKEGDMEIVTFLELARWKSEEK